MLMNFVVRFESHFQGTSTCRSPKTRKDPNPLVSSILDIKLILHSQLLNSVYIFKYT